MPHSSSLSLWDETAAEADLVAPLTTDLVTDIAVVGGGFTGLSTALHAAQNGLDVCVLEARQIGYGGSGRNVGLVNAGLWLPPQDVRAHFGEERGARLVEVLGNGPDYVMSLIETHQIRCELTRTGTIHAAHSPRGYRDLARRAEEWRRLGAPVSLLTREQACERIGSEAFHGGLLDQRAGTINPMGYVRGLTRAARAAGARIHTGARVRSLIRAGDVWRLETANSCVRARSVVLATNAYTDGLWPGLRDSFVPINYFQVATMPLGERVASILPERQGLWDTGKIMFSLRRDAADRLVIGSMGSVIGGENGLSERWAARQLKRLFPQLGPVAFETSWHGQIAMTADHIPRIHRLADGVYTPIGYNGRGIAPGTIFGKAMAELLAGGDEKDLPLPVTGVKPETLRRVKAGFYQTAFSANQIFKSI
ncbi:glycine/D-amino acid oxidase-like deaminating enzyme [Hoeflea halophila]|uniref:Glycine/D-amino acid oxidase-like deaminating enzyme n=1 Tax=Hoeflea halophila TaxID=714899 RepID=A0A286HLY7_9HYPH|nr:FAD-binding oxidoreductase [Hoeflea halophila]SOE08727.1 glycine/D-amino acid oxidase-like deaminating enzyme [Hoeflea halophila]